MEYDPQDLVEGCDLPALLGAIDLLVGTFPNIRLRLAIGITSAALDLPDGHEACLPLLKKARQLVRALLHQPTKDVRNLATP